MQLAKGIYFIYRTKKENWNIDNEQTFYSGKLSHISDEDTLLTDFETINLRVCVSAFMSFIYTCVFETIYCWLFDIWFYSFGRLFYCDVCIRGNSLSGKGFEMNTTSTS